MECGGLALTERRSLIIVTGRLIVFTRSLEIVKLIKYSQIKSNEGIIMDKILSSSSSSRSRHHHHYLES